MRKPKALPPGGTIGIVSPSSPTEPESLQAGQAVLAARGFQTVLAPHALDRRGHMAGRDADRARDFQGFYADPAIDIIWCARGGSSACRLWPLLDWARLVAAPPKMVVGYSDTTSLLVPLNQIVNTVSLHGPLVFEVGCRTPSEMLDWQLRLFQSPLPAGDVPGRGSETLVSGQAEGLLCGGCLSLVAATLGTPYQINSAGKLLLIEDIDEAPHRVERFLVQMREAGILASAAGFVIGTVTDCLERPNGTSLRQIWEDVIKPLGKPTVLGFPFGHVPNNYALPLGVRARLNADAQTLTLLEGAVK